MKFKFQCPQNSAMFNLSVQSVAVFHYNNKDEELQSRLQHSDTVITTSFEWLNYHSTAALYFVFLFYYQEIPVMPKQENKNKVDFE